MAVALSGGVDSSAAALLLRDRYPRFVGATHFIWPDSRCCSLTVFKRAEYLARKLSIPYFVVDVQAAFRGDVVDEFIASYIAGATPNPCVRCNERVRFTVFYDELRKKLLAENLLSDGEELLFATGHYARVGNEGGRYFIRKGRDPVKDQSYMLYRLPQALLPRLVFPLGGMLKKEAIEYARLHGLSAAEEPESQDACFVDSSYIDFIVRETGRADLRAPGEIVDTAGRKRGEHRGYIGYTVGQRRGLGLGDGPWYVAGVDPERNRVIVGREEEAGRREFTVGNANWFIAPPEKSLRCGVRIRYQTHESDCLLEPLGDGRVRAVIDRPEFVTPGQSAVFYDGDAVMGGGVIERPEI
ncbi:MAG: tRNA 2-thiouridine(34) synthase MnmA [Spirochaetales bacterium]|nr:tRNA 2-thiouridine(34) synthase MnmA [Spirochaetales bacterium]